MKPLPSGYTLRALCPGDELTLSDFFHSHTPETIYMRYGYAMGDISHNRAKALVGVDQIDDVALGIFQPQDGGEILHAIGRYYTEPSRSTAEIAFVVRESERHHGLATCILFNLALAAKCKGLKAFHAYVLHENVAMRELLFHYTGRLSPSFDADMLKYVLEIDRLLSALTHKPLHGVRAKS